MRIAIVYYSKTGSTEKVALTIQQQLQLDGHSVKMVRISPSKELKAYQYKKNGKGVKLKTSPIDVKNFDLLVIGTPVWNFCPTPIVLSYLRGLRSAGGKRFVLFATCTALPGSTIQRMGSILTTKGGQILDTLTIRSIFALDEAKLAQARQFSKQLEKKL